jgi:hypothetical protein
VCGRARRRVVEIVIGIVFCLAAHAAEAAPISLDVTNVWRADRAPNPIGFLPTAIVPWITVTSANGFADAQIVATVNGTNFALVNFLPVDVDTRTYFRQILYNPALMDGQAWTVTATSGADSDQENRPAFLPVDAMPFVSSIGFSGTGTSLTVEWTVSAEGLPRLDLQQASI